MSRALGLGIPGFCTLAAILGWAVLTYEVHPVVSAATDQKEEHAGTPAGMPTPEQRAELIKAVEKYAAALSPKDKAKAQLYLEEVLKIETRLDQVHGRTALGGVHAHLPTAPKVEANSSPFAHARAVAEAKAAARLSIETDPTWQKNWEKLFQMSMIEDPGRIFGGRRTRRGDFPHCVTIGTSSRFCCTGTVIGPNVVLTAGHCIDGDCAARIFIGIDSNQPQTGKIIMVKQAILHPNYDPVTLENDVGILILAENVPPTVPPCKIAAANDVDSAFFLRLVGFGFTERQQFGIQFRVDVAIASHACSTVPTQNKFGCHADKEIVAGGRGFDSCNGDSGGPAYVVKGKELLLAGSTSRATRNSVNNCGDGGVYVRTDRYVPWIRKTAKDNGGVIP